MTKKKDQAAIDAALRQAKSLLRSIESGEEGIGQIKSDLATWRRMFKASYKAARDAGCTKKAAEKELGRKNVTTAEGN